ncbi:MAG: prepilin-type N-terminal cleavage/methylation domain-containing protein [Candidatus Omnitrophica bacterium]|nr:prepilin-type N-terminal cleavage/methylation domain-containing protein [Candidatus Omnitrophota bacterium]
MGRRCKNKNKSFSLVEIITVIIILGILAAIASPSYHRMIERSRGKHAEFNLMAVYNAQKRHRLAQKTYYQCVSAPCGSQELEDHLGVYINDPYFNYGIVANTTTFTATATRINSNLCLGATMNVSDSGSEPIKGCDLW